MNTNKQSHDLEDILAVKSKYESALMQKANVVGVGVGMPIREHKPVGEIGIIVNVSRKMKVQDLAPEDLVPRDLEGVRVWVEEIGQPHAQQDR
jgi:hypothetical protein